MRNHVRAMGRLKGMMPYANRLLIQMRRKIRCSAQNEQQRDAKPIS